MTLDRDFAVTRYTGQEIAFVAQSLDQCTGAAVDKALDEPLVQRVGQGVFDDAGPGAPVIRVADPVGTVRRIGPGAHIGKACRQGVQLAGRLVQPVQLAGHPVVGKVAARAGQVHEDGFYQACVRVQRCLAEIRQAAGIPKRVHAVASGCAIADLAIGGQNTQGPLVHRFADALQGRMTRGLAQRILKCLQRALVEIGIAPLQFFHRSKAVRLDRLDNVGIEGAAVGGLAETAIAAETACPAGNLPQLGRGQAPPAAPVELAALGKGDMVDIHVQSHPDRIGCNQEIDLA